ncbi:MAG: ABC transporter ATP-binding protein [Firmicutes bacterium]|nr:ABC transporter ATP-binding protein [Candidatus Colivicinus equi]
MKYLFKYIKPYILVVLMIFVFTFVQVQTELALPDYMADIVTDGIQYAGIVETVPKAITSKDMNELLLFTKDDEQILKQYSLIEKGNKAVVDNKEIEFIDDVYVLKEDYEDISSIIEMPIVSTYICHQQNLDVNTVDISTIQTNLKGLEENYSSMVKLYTGQLYRNVGLNCETIQTNYILISGLKMLGIAAISVVAQLVTTYLATKTAAKIATKMRKDVFEKVESFSSSEFSKFSTSSLITRTSNDVTKAQQLIQMMLRMMMIAPMMGLTAVAKVSQYPGVSWLLVVAICIIVAGMIVLAIFAVPKFEIIQRLVDKINSITREYLDGMLVIRAFNSQPQEEEKFDETNREFRKIDRFVSNMVNIAMPIMTLVLNGLTVAITWFSAKQIDLDVMSIGDMMAFSQYAMHVVMSFMIVTVMFFMIPRSLVSVRRIEEVMNTKNTILDDDNPETLPKENGVLSFNNVTFKYPGASESVLDNISFKANPGETVAFIGSTGSGKSTIIKLIPRLFDVSGGSITYCGHDIRKVKQADLHDKIGYATQKAILFSGDIKSNIEFGREISDADLNEAIDISQSRNILEENAEGIHTPITQGGSNVSGGQKQRISIARTLADKKNIYIFDDSFSALDYATDKKLRSELNELIKKTKSTVLIVAQRISTIKNSDKIIVLDEGKIVGQGTHEELLKNCDVYQQIAYSQLSKEELA